MTTTIMVTSLYFSIFFILLVILYSLYKVDGQSYANIYKHFFLYPIFFGTISVAALSYGISVAPHQFNQDNLLKLLAISTLASAIALLAEMRSEDYAPWEFTPDSIANNDSVREHPITTKKSDGDIDQKRSDYKMEIKILAKSGDWSLMRYFYPIGFFIQTKLLVFLFCFIGVSAMAMRRSCIESMNSMKWLSVSLFCSLPYMYLRLIFVLTDKDRIFGSDSYPFSVVCIVLLYMVALMFFAYYYYSRFADYMKSVVCLVGIIPGFIIPLNPQILEMDHRVSLWNYALVTLTISVILSVFLIGANQQTKNREEIL